MPHAGVYKQPAMSEVDQYTPVADGLALLHLYVCSVVPHVLVFPVGLAHSKQCIVTV